MLIYLVLGGYGNDQIIISGHASATAAEARRHLEGERTVKLTPDRDIPLYEWTEVKEIYLYS